MRNERAGTVLVPVVEVDSCAPAEWDSCSGKKIRDLRRQSYFPVGFALVAPVRANLTT